jgi:hypothetical protein
MEETEMKYEVYASDKLEEVRTGALPRLGHAIASSQEAALDKFRKRDLEGYVFVKGEDDPPQCLNYVEQL